MRSSIKYFFLFLINIHFTQPNIDFLLFYQIIFIYRYNRIFLIVKNATFSEYEITRRLRFLLESYLLVGNQRVNLLKSQWYLYISVDLDWIAALFTTVFKNKKYFYMTKSIDVMDSFPILIQWKYIKNFVSRMNRKYWRY